MTLSNLKNLVSSLPQKLFASGSWLEKKQTSILSAAIVITSANIIASLTGLLREKLLISKFFGDLLSEQAYEAFLIAFQVPDLIYQLVILGAMSAAFIPIFTEIRNKYQEETAFKMTSAIMNWLLSIFTVVGVIVFIFAPQITMARTGASFTAEQVIIVTNLTRIMIFAQLFFAISNFFSGMLQSYKKFIIPALSPIIYNAGIVLGTYLFYAKLGVYGAGVGVLVGAFLHMLIQWPSVHKIGWHYSWSWNLNLPGVKRLFRMMPPRMLTLGANELQTLGLGFFTTQIGGLSFIIIKLAKSLIALPIRFFGVPIAQAALPFLSDEGDENSRLRFSQIITRSLSQIAFFALPASVLILILRIPIVRLVYGAKDFPWTTTVTLGRVVAIISVSIAAQAIYQLLARGFFALKDTRTPFYISLVTTTLFLLSCWIITFFSDDATVYGLAWIICLIAFLEALLYLIFLNKKVGHLINKELIVSLLKIAFVSFVMGIALYIPFKALDQFIFDTTRVIPLIGLTVITSFVGIGVFLGLAWMMRIKELEIIPQLANHFNRKTIREIKTPETLVVTNDDDASAS